MPETFSIRRFRLEANPEPSSVCPECGASLSTEQAGELVLRACSTNEQCGTVLVDGAQVRRVLERCLPGDTLQSIWKSDAATGSETVSIHGPAGRPVEWLWDGADDAGKMDMLQWVLLQSDAKSFSSVFREFSEDAFCSLLDDSRTDGPLSFQRLALRTLSGYFSDQPRPEHEWQALWRWLSAVLAMAAAEELIRRVQVGETRSGEILRNWAATGPDGLSDRDLKYLALRAQRRRYHPDEQEQDAVFAAALVEKMDATMADFFQAPVGQQLRMFLSGRFERALSQADNKAREETRSALKRSKRELQPPEGEQQWPPSRLAVAIELSRETLIAELFPGVTDRDRQFLELTFQGYNQAEIARRFQLTQGRVSQILKQAFIQWKNSRNPVSKSRTP